MPDWKYAGIAALVFLGIAAFILFAIHPGGFEGQIVWFFGLLPGAFVVATVSDRLSKIAPFLAALTPWPFIFCASFLWYFTISYALIKSFRLVSTRFNRSIRPKSR
jgi:hypothetical protein